MKIDVSNGSQGGVFIDDTSAHPGPFTCFYPATDCVINAATACNIGNIAGKTMPAGIPIFGSFDSITLTSGSGTAYRPPANT